MSDLRIENDDCVVRLMLNRIYFDSVADENEIIDAEGADEFPHCTICV